MLVLTFAKVELHRAPNVLAHPTLAWRFDPHQLLDALRTHPFAFVLFALAELSLIPLRAFQWGWVLPPGLSKQRDRTHAVALGGLAQNVLPARAGELVRALSLSQRCDSLGRTRSLATVLISKLAELAAMLTFVALAPLGLSAEVRRMSFLRHATWIGFAVLGALLALAWLLTRARGRMHRIEAAWRHWPLGLGRRLAVLLEELAHGAAACRSPSRMGGAYVFSLATVGMTIVAAACALRGVGAPGSLGTATVVMAAVNLGMSIPSSPSGVGIYHLVCLATLTALGHTAAQAAAFALSTHLISVFINVGIGLLSLWQSRTSLLGLLSAPRT
jgi:uncharacterized protein (TIRG00374 family)